MHTDHKLCRKKYGLSRGWLKTKSKMTQVRYRLYRTLLWKRYTCTGHVTKHVTNVCIPVNGSHDNNSLILVNLSYIEIS